jgi:hypothetical protein
MTHLPCQDALAMARASTRELTAQDQQRMNTVFAELRAHFHEWSHFESEHDLVGFAFYEGCGASPCCGAILSKAAPLALGRELVLKHGFHWVMVRSESGWHYAVTHSTRGLFINVESLEEGSWMKNEDDTKPAGRRTHDSYDAIVAHLNG